MGTERLSTKWDSSVDSTNDDISDSDYDTSTNDEMTVPMFQKPLPTTHKVNNNKSKPRIVYDDEEAEEDSASGDDSENDSEDDSEEDGSWGER